MDRPDSAQADLDQGRQGEEDGCLVCRGSYTLTSSSVLILCLKKEKENTALSQKIQEVHRPFHKDFGDRATILIFSFSKQIQEHKL